MREMVIALGLIEQGDHYILQLRGDNPMIGGAGLIGCFGGKLEEGESPVAAVCREIAEETTHISSEDKFTALGKVEVISDHKMENIKILGHAFHLALPDTAEITAKEGELIRLLKSDIAAHLGKMTTGTRACFEQFILQEA
jgi:8-oxo-dGTP pyrophosphatase MutT (NUDIX family)